MSRALAARLALVGLALAAVAWVAHGLRAVELHADATATLEGAGRPPDASAARRARSLLRDAARGNADPAPRLDEAALLMDLGRDRDAARLLEDVVRDNPGSIRGWGLLAAATADLDDERSLQANGRLLRLYGRVQGRPLARGTIRAVDGRRFTVVPGGFRGSVDSSDVRRGRAYLSGWALRRDRPEPAAAVVVVSHGRVVLTAAPNRRRTEVAKRYGVRTALVGFNVSIPLERVRAGGQTDVHVFAAAAGVASPIVFRCASPLQELAC